MKEKIVYIILVILGIAVILAGCIRSSPYSASGRVVDLDDNGVPNVTLSFGDYGFVESDIDGNWTKNDLSGTVSIIPGKRNFEFYPNEITVTENKSKIEIVAYSTTEKIVFDSIFYDWNPEIEEPKSIALGPDHYIYILTSKNVLYTFDDEGEIINQIQLNQASEYSNMDIDETGKIYITEEQKQIIEIYSEGSLIQTISNIKFSWLAAIAIDRDNQLIYIADNAQIHKLNYNGDLLQSFGDLWQPLDIIVDNDNNLIVLNTNNARIEKYNPSGEKLWEFGEVGTGQSQFNYPYGLAVDLHNNIYVSERARIGAGVENHRVQIFNTDGDFIYTFGKEGEGVQEFKFPARMIITQDENNQYLYVLDSWNYRVQKFKINLGE